MKKFSSAYIDKNMQLIINNMKESYSSNVNKLNNKSSRAAIFSTFP
jgi:hypothetical protein